MSAEKASSKKSLKKSRPAVSNNSRESARAMLVPRFLNLFEPHVQEAAKRLVEDRRMDALWASGFDSGTAFQAVLEFAHANYRDPWANKSQRLRDQWLSKFEKSVDSLLQLMEEAPTRPMIWGFPVRDNVLMNVVSRMGVALPEHGTQEFDQAMERLERLADAENWTIADALKHFRERQRMDCKAAQILKKPGDAMAARAEFVMWLHRASRVSVQQIVTVVEVMFGDEKFDDRQARKIIGRGQLSRSHK